MCYSAHSVDHWVPVLLPISSTLIPSPCVNHPSKGTNLWDETNAKLKKKGKLNAIPWENPHSVADTHWNCIHGELSTYANNGSYFWCSFSANSNLIKKIQGEITCTTHCSTNSGTQSCLPWLIIPSIKNNIKMLLGKHFPLKSTEIIQRNTDLHQAEQAWVDRLLVEPTGIKFMSYHVFCCLRLHCVKMKAFMKTSWQYLSLIVPNFYMACPCFQSFGMPSHKSPNSRGMKGLAFLKFPMGTWLKFYLNGRWLWKLWIVSVWRVTVVRYLKMIQSVMFNVMIMSLMMWYLMFYTRAKFSKTEYIPSNRISVQKEYLFTVATPHILCFT